MVMMKKYKKKNPDFPLWDIFIFLILCIICLIVAIYQNSETRTILLILGAFIVFFILYWINYKNKNARVTNNTIAFSEYSIKQVNKKDAITEIFWTSIIEIKDRCDGIRIKDKKNKNHIDIDYDYQDFDELIKHILQNVYANKIYILPMIFRRNLLIVYSVPILFYLPVMLVLSLLIYKNDPDLKGLILFWIAITIPVFIFLIHDFLKSVKYICVGKSNIEILKGIDKHYVSYNNIKDIKFEIKHIEEILKLELKLIATNGREINILPIGGNIFEIYSTIAYAKRNL